jgi:hypothetical protein
MKTLNLSKGSFDQDNTFTIGIQGYSRMKRMTVSLHSGYHTKDDGIFWALQAGGCLKSEYTQKDHEETRRLGTMTPVKHGDLVLIDGIEYKVRVLGDFSDCAIFEPVV